MAYKDLPGYDSETEASAMFFSRPLILPGQGFGAFNFFFDPTELSPKEIEALGNMLADVLDTYFVEKEANSRVTN
jgi:hypothetical protein